MEQAIIDFFNAIMAKFPMAASIYMIAAAVYTLFCAIAAITKTDKDDKWADRLRVFFSLPVRKNKPLQ